MKLLTVKEYANSINKPILRVYQMIHAKKKPLKHVREYGRILIPVEEEVVNG